ncbi:MAG: hypothetical protein RLZZ65_197 [Bacteroidota bacterium]
MRLSSSTLFIFCITSLKFLVLFLIYKILFPIPLRILGIKIYGRKHLSTQKQFILVANHNSHLDTMSLLSSIPLDLLAKTHPVATSQYFGRKKFLVLLSNFLVNTVLIQRKEDEQPTPEGQTEKSNALELLEKKLAQGHSLILFPEGTRGQPEQMQDFRKGIGVLLQKFPNIPYIPVYIQGMGKILPKDSLLPVPFDASVSIGTAKFAQNENIVEIVEEVRREILNLKD